MFQVGSIFGGVFDGTFERLAVLTFEDIYCCFGS